jgi:hypothetical protein
MGFDFQLQHLWAVMNEIFGGGSSASVGGRHELPIRLALSVVASKILHHNTPNLRIRDGEKPAEFRPRRHAVTVARPRDQGRTSSILNARYRTDHYPMV